MPTTFFNRPIPLTQQRSGIDVGILRRVDRWNMRGDVEFITRAGGLFGVPFMGGMSARSMCGSLPAEGSLVEITYILGQNLTREPYIAGVVPSNFRTAHELNTVRELASHRPIRPQAPHIVPGSFYVHVPDMSTFQLVERVGAVLLLPDQQKFLVFHHDHSMLHESPYQRWAGAGNFHNFGMISRPNSSLHQYMTVAGEMRNYVTAKADGTMETLFNSFEPSIRGGYDGERKFPNLEQPTMDIFEGDSYLVLKDGTFFSASVTKDQVLKALKNYPKTFEDWTILSSAEQTGSRVLLEDSVVLWETSDSIVPVYQLSERDREKYAFDYEPFPLLMEQAGTVVGLHPDMDGYGKPVYYKLFDAIDDYAPSNPQFIGVDATLDKDRMVFQFALVKMLYLPREKTRKTAFCLDKQGKAFFKLGMSLRDSESSYQTSGYTEDPLGPHRSVEGSLDGSAKVHVGKNWNQEVSLDLSTEGKVRERIGKDNGSKGATPLMISIDLSTEGKCVLHIKDDSGGSAEQLLSVDMTTTRGVKLVVQGPASNGRAIDVDATGNVYVHATGKIDLVSDVEINLIAPITRAFGDFKTPDDVTSVACCPGCHVHTYD